MTGLADHTKRICQHLLGAPNRELSTEDQWRYGSKGSLAVEVAGDVAGTWFDHEDQTGGGILDLISREKCFSNGEAFTWLHEELGIGDDPERRYKVTGTWVYRDREGEPLYRVVRRDAEGKPKKIHQERYDAATKSYVSGKGAMKDVRLVPYRLNEWHDRAALILIAEGERKVDALMDLGWQATSNPGGAGKFSKGFAPYFEGSCVVILPDNDSAGRDHAREVAAILEPVAASIRILELAGLPPKGDVIDWLKAGGTESELRALIDGAPYADEVIAKWPEKEGAATDDGDDRLERLVKQAGTDPGAPFESEAVDFLAALRARDPAAYERARGRLKKARVRVAALDHEVERRKPEAATDDAPGKGKALDLPEPELWGEPVDGAELLAGLIEQIQRYVIVSDHAALGAALWGIHAHAHDAAFHSPRLTLTSPTMRCGKSTMLRTIGRLIPRPLPTANITPAALFRVVEAAKPSLLIDEADSFAHENEELRGVINSSHCRLDAFVVRAVPAGDDYEARRFSTWAPMAIASIGKVASTIADRSIIIGMERKPLGETVARMRSDRDDGFGVLARKAARWVADHLEQLRQSDPDVPQALNDRQADNWRPLLAIADLAGGEWPARARAAARALSTTDEDADTIGVQLLAAVKLAFGTARQISTDNLLKHLHAMSEAPWGEYGRQRKPITPRQLAGLLRPFGIASGTIRESEISTPKGYRREQFESAWDRYLSATTPQPRQSATFDVSSSATNHPDVADRGSEKPKQSVAYGAVADGKGESGGYERERVGQCPVCHFDVFHDNCVSLHGVTLHPPCVAEWRRSTARP
jgi:hypothetical protein